MKSENEKDAGEDYTCFIIRFHLVMSVMINLNTNARILTTVTFLRVFGNNYKQ